MPIRKSSRVARQKQSTKQTAKSAEPKKSVSIEEGKSSVSYTISITRNLGDFESLKIQAGITVPHGASDKLLEELDELLVVSRVKVVSRLSQDLDDIENSLT